MEFLNRPRSWVVVGVAILGILLLQQLWHWEVERKEVPPGEFLVRIGLWGKDLGADQIIAPDESYKGVMEDVLPEGRHFLNPLLWSYERHKMVQVPPGKCLVLTRKFGKPIADPLAAGAYLAGAGERGIVPEVKLPGSHRINPYAYDHALHDAVEVHANEVGVRTLKWGKDPRGLAPDPDRSAYVVPDGYRGVQEKPRPPGTYYVNPYVEEIVCVDTRSHQVEFKDISFPSRDGFLLKPHVLVTYKVEAAKAPELFVMLTDEGKLSQADATPEQQAKNPILRKVVLPLVRGDVRLKGSRFFARDFVAQKAGPLGAKAANPREELQRELMTAVTPECRKVGVIIESITLGQNEMTDDLKELAGLISEREQTRLQRETNAQLIEQYTSQQEQQAKDMLADQKTKVVTAETKLKVAQENAKQRLQVEEAKLEQDLKSAKLRLEAAENEVEAIKTLARSEAAVITAQNEAEVADLRTAVGGFPTSSHFAQYHVLTKLAPALKEIFASDQSEFAKLFAAYLTPPRAQARTAPPEDTGTARADRDMPPAK